MKNILERAKNELRAHRIIDTDAQADRLKTAILATDERAAADSLSYLCGYLTSHAKHYENLTAAQVLNILACELERAAARRPASALNHFRDTPITAIMRHGNHGT